MKKTFNSSFTAVGSVLPLVLALMLFGVGCVQITIIREPAKASNSKNLIVNGSFETPLVPASTNLWAWIDSAGLQPWQTDMRHFEIWSDGYAPPDSSAMIYFEPCRSAAGHQNLEIISDAAFKASVWQTVATIPGKSYTLSFYHTPRPGAHSALTVSANAHVIGTFDENGAGSSRFYWRKFSATFKADGAITILKFADETKTVGQGTHIDGVTLKAD